MGAIGGGIAGDVGIQQRLFMLGIGGKGFF
jgi:hypothetical protein